RVAGGEWRVGAEPRPPTSARSGHGTVGALRRAAGARRALAGLRRAGSRTRARPGGGFAPAVRDARPPRPGVVSAPAVGDDEPDRPVVAPLARRHTRGVRGRDGGCLRRALEGGDVG